MISKRFRLCTGDGGNDEIEFIVQMQTCGKKGVPYHTSLLPVPRQTENGEPLRLGIPTDQSLIVTTILGPDPYGTRLNTKALCSMPERKGRHD